MTRRARRSARRSSVGSRKARSRPLVPSRGDGWTPEKAYADAGVPLRPEDDRADAFPELAVWERGFRSGYTCQAEIDAESAHDGPNVLGKQTHPAEEK